MSFKIIKKDSHFHNLLLKKVTADNFELSKPRYWAVTLQNDTQIISFPASPDFLDVRIVKFDTLLSNPDNYYDTTTGMFTVPDTGFYTVDCEVNYIANGNNIGNRISTEFIKSQQPDSQQRQIKSIRRNLTLNNGQIYDESFSVTLPMVKGERYYLGIVMNNINGITVNQSNAYAGGITNVSAPATRSNLRITRLL